MKKSTTNVTELTRRDFLKGSSVGTLMALMGNSALQAQEAAAAPAVQQFPVALIGCGYWGRDLLKTLGGLPQAKVVGVCDTYEPYLRRAHRSAPQAKAVTDYRELLADPQVKGVLIATPTQLHKDIVLDALKAKKHVYCEAPLASTVADAQVIAQAAKQTVPVNFQSGLQYRADPERKFLLDFIRANALGGTIEAKAQWHKKQSMRRTSPNPERVKALNWRLDGKISPGLVAELSIHQLDAASWFLGSLPAAVTAHGAILTWKDGRDVPDTVQAIFEYPDEVRLLFDLSIGNSFDGENEVYYGGHSAIMVRGSQAWMFKEVDAPLLGWEVYAEKDTFYEETGIALVANATKQTTQSKNASGNQAPSSPPPIHHALHAFLSNSIAHQQAVEDFTSFYSTDDPKALATYLKDALGKTKVPAAGYQEGYSATVLTLKVNEAAVQGQGRRIVYQPEWFKIS